MAIAKQQGFSIPLPVKWLFHLIWVFNKKSAVKFGAQVFFRVPKFPVPNRELPFQESASRRTVWTKKREIRLFCWGPPHGEIVFLIHGWAGRATQLGDIAERLANKGFQVIGIDMPAHGESSGRRTSLIEFAKTIKQVHEHVGVDRIHAIIGHSMGGVASILSASNHPVFDRMVIIGAPSDTLKILSSYASSLGMSGDQLKAFFNHMESYYQVRLADFSAHHLAKGIKVKGLIIHDENDQEVPLSSAKMLQKSWENSDLMVTTGLGHRKILGNSAVIDRIEDFIKLY